MGSSFSCTRSEACEDNHEQQRTPSADRRFKIRGPQSYEVDPKPSTGDDRRFKLRPEPGELARNCDSDTRATKKENRRKCDDAAIMMYMNQPQAMAATQPATQPAINASNMCTAAAAASYTSAPACTPASSVSSCY